MRKPYPLVMNYCGLQFIGLFFCFAMEQYETGYETEIGYWKVTQHHIYTLPYKSHSAGPILRYIQLL